ncbi:MAG: hypothetical protein NC420_09925 [Eubacterium sp.]|nr:hypothetical protein [Eubacterium sp.]MCM1303823.1 hypothetical protein [Butyrivibrio sp.]MCM1342865.1 hypothetical protein [Muribaculaceae bacterium]MCM1410492.1 hypothetical protein [Lachnospiraceae bacterium]
MSVGAGSIKRAAKAAEGSVETKAVESAEVKAAKKSTVTKTAETAKDNARSKTAKGSKAASAVKSDEKAATDYVAYGVGQELPVYLM